MRTLNYEDPGDLSYARIDFATKTWSNGFSASRRSILFMVFSIGHAVPKKRAKTSSPEETVRATETGGSLVEEAAQESQDPTERQQKLEARIVALKGVAQEQVEGLSTHMEMRTAAHEAHAMESVHYIQDAFSETVGDLRKAKESVVSGFETRDRRAGVIRWLMAILLIVTEISVGIDLWLGAPTIWASYWVEYSLFASAVAFGSVWTLLLWLPDDERATRRTVVGKLDATMIDLAGAPADAPRIDGKRDESKSLSGSVSTTVNALVGEVSKFLPGMKAVIENVEEEGRRDRFKGDVRYCVQRYGFRLTSSLESIVASFKSALSGEDDWLGAVTLKISDELGVSPDLFRLMFLEALGRTGRARVAWASISTGDRHILSSTLVRNGVVRSASGMDEATTADSVYMLLREMSDGFSIEEAVRCLATFEHSRTVFLDHVGEVQNRFRLSSEVLDRTRLFVPSRASMLESEGLSLCAETAGVNHDVMRLVYAGTFSDDRSAAILSKMHQESTCKALVAFLRGRESALEGIPDSDLLAWVESQTIFDTSSSPQLLRRFGELSSLARTLSDFLSDEGLPVREITSDSLTVLAKSDEFSPVGNLLVKSLSSRLDLEKLRTLLSGLNLDSDALESLTVASVTLFLHERAVTTGAERKAIAQESAARTLSLRILYEWASLRDALKDSPERVTLGKAVLNAFVQKEDLPHIEEVRVRLLSGAVPLRLSDFATAKLDALKQRFDELGAKVEGEVTITKVLENLSTSVRKFFEAHVRAEAVPQFLRDQLVSAYLITSPSDIPLIQTIESEDFETALSDLSRTDPRFERLLVTAKGSGKATRIGVLPPGMGFHEFVEMLGSVLKQAKTYNDGVLPSGEPMAEMVHVMRISASKDAMETITPPDFRGQTLESIILALMTEQFTSRERVTILSAADTQKAANLALRDVTEGVLNREETTLVGMAESEIGVVLTHFPSLKKIENQKAIDAKVLDAFRAPSLVDLCKLIAGLIDSSGHTAATRQFRGALKEAVPRALSASSDDFEVLTAVLFSTAKSVGITLTM